MELRSYEEDIFSVTIDVTHGERLGLLLAGGLESPIEIKSWVILILKVITVNVVRLQRKITLTKVHLSVQDGSLAGQSGLTGGLQILSVNNIIFAPTTSHHDAIMALTSSNKLSIAVKVGVQWNELWAQN